MSGLRAWLVPVAVLVVALSTAFLIERLYESAHRRHDAQVLLAQIEEEVNEQQLGEYAAINEQEVTPEIAAQISSSRQDIMRALDGLEKLSFGNAESARIRELLSAGEAAIDEELRLIEEGRLEEADAIDEEEVDPTFEELRGVLEIAASGYEGYALRVDLIADVGTYAVAVSAVFLTALFVRHARNRRAEQRVLQESEERFRSLVQNASDVVMITGADGTINYISPAVERVLGYKPEDIVGTTSFTPVHPDDLERVLDTIADALSGPGVVTPMELRLQHANGSWRHIESNCTNLLRDPAINGLVVNSRDVTERKLAERELERSEERYRALYEDNPSMYFTLDAEGTVLSVNRFGAEQLGYSPEDLVGRPVLNIFYEEDKGAVLRNFEDCLSHPGRVDSWELRKVREGGDVIWVKESARAVTDASGNAVVLVVCEDITERKLTEDALRRRESELTAAQRIAQVGNWTIQIDEDEIRWSDEMYRIFGFAPQEFPMTYKKFVRLVHPDDRRHVQKAIREAVYGDEDRHSLDYRLVRPNGEVRFLHSQYESVREGAGRSFRLVGTSQDVTERKQAQEALQQSEERYRAVVEQAGEGIFLFDPQTKRILESNLAFQQMFGYAREELARMRVYDLVPQDPEGVDRNVERALERGHVLVGEREYRRKDSSKIDVEVSGSVISYSGQQVVCSVIHDVTERKRAEEALQENHNLLREVTEGSTDAIFVKDRDGSYLMVNSAFSDLFGRPVEEVLGRHDGELFAPDEARAIEEDDHRIMAAGETRTYEETLTFAGRERTYLTTKGVRRDHRGNVAGVFGVARDITERKRAEELLQQRSAAMDASIDGMAILDENAAFTYVNEAHAEIYGYGDPEELVGQKWEVLYDEEQLEWFQRQLMSTLWEDGHWRGEAVGKRRDSSPFPQEVSITTVGGSGFVCVVRDITERKRIEEEIRQLNEGLEARVIERTAQLESAVRESRRAAEALRESEARLKQSNRELQEFAYVASHDLQEPLRKVRTFGGRLRAKYGGALDERGQDYLVRMEGATARMQDLIDDLLTLSRVTTEARPFVPVDLGEVALEVLSDLETRVEQVGGRVEVSGLPTIEADRPQIRQLLQNLIGNALKFHKGGEAPTVRVRGETPNGQDGNSAGTKICRLVVEDDGIGFDEKHLERIFAPFERLHGRAAYEGTGMGLAICRKVVERHGGEITAASAPGSGTKFTITLPLEQSARSTHTERGEADDYAAASR